MLSNFERRNRIDVLFDQLESKGPPTSFMLDQETHAIMKEVAQLQRECPHIFENGQCTICRKNSVEMEK